MPKNPFDRFCAPLVVEVSTPMRKMLTALVATGLWGPNEETAAQRVLEQWMMERVMQEHKDIVKATASAVAQKRLEKKKK